MQRTISPSSRLSPPSFAVSHGSEKRARKCHRTVRFAADELVVIDAAADCAGLMFGSYVRQVLLSAPAPRQVRRPPVDRRELARLLGEIGRIGGNINQLAKAANSGVLIYETDLDAATRAVVDMRDALLKALGRAP